MKARLSRGSIARGVLYLVISCCLVSACSRGAPRCSEKEVKSMVTSLSGDILLTDPAFFQVVMKISSAVRDHKDDHDKQLLYLLLQGIVPKVSFVQQSKNPEVLKISKELSKIIDGMTLESVRTDSVDEVAKKSFCQAELINKAEGYQSTVNYTAQTTDDGKLRVEVH